MVGKIGSHEIAGAKECTQPHVARIVAEADIVADNASGLTRLVVAAETRTGGDADNAVELNARIHHHVHDSRREEATHGAPLEHKPGFGSFLAHGFKFTIN